MQIISKNRPFLVLKFADKSVFELNMETFLKSMIKDQKSPYWELLSPEVFDKVYVAEDKLVWENTIEAMVCSGEINKHHAVFTEKEIWKYLTATLENE